MQCKIIRDDMEVSRKCQNTEQTEMKEVKRNGRLTRIRVWKQGAVLTHPQAHLLVKQGCAIPHDEECREAVNMLPSELATAQQAYERVTRGIHPDDYEKFDRGQIEGYNPDGSYIPGPNFFELAAAQDEETDE